VVTLIECGFGSDFEEMNREIQCIDIPMATCTYKKAFMKFGIWKDCFGDKYICRGNRSKNLSRCSKCKYMKEEIFHVEFK